MKNSKIIAVALLSFGLISLTSAQNSEQKGLLIAQEADKKDNGWQSSSMSFTMTLTNKSGQETTRKLHSFMQEVENDGDQSLVIFDSPSDVKGTASLVYSHKIGDDDQWLYLPAIKQVKRIASSNKSGPFMGSEFAYEDMASQEIEKFTYKYLNESQANNTSCLLVERYPVDKKSGYSKQQVWYNKANFRIEKIDYYDRKGVLVKTLTYNGYKQYLSQYWKPDEMEMINHQTGKKTLLKFSDYRFDIGLTQDDFTQNSLINAR